MSIRRQHHLDQEHKAADQGDRADGQREDLVAHQADLIGVDPGDQQIGGDADEEDKRGSFGAGRRIVGAQDLLALADADDDRNDGQRQDDQDDRRGDIGHAGFEALAKLGGGDLVRLVREAFGLRGEDEADSESGSRPLEPAKEDAEHADRHQGSEVAEGLAGLEGGERDHHEQEGRHQGEADRGQARDLAG